MPRRLVSNAVCRPATSGNLLVVWHQPQRGGRPLGAAANPGTQVSVPHAARGLRHCCPSRHCRRATLLPRLLLLPGGGLHDAHVVKGMVLKRDVEGSVKSVDNAKVAVFAHGVDAASTETKVGGLQDGRRDKRGPGWGCRRKAVVRMGGGGNAGAALPSRTRC